MKSSGITAIVNNALYKAAIQHLVSEVKTGEQLEFKDNLQECLNNTCRPNYLIIDANAIPEPISYSLERIKTKNSECSIMVLNAEKFQKSAMPYVHSLHLQTDSETEIRTKFQAFLSTNQSANNHDTSDNTISEREKEVLHLVALGKTNKEISEALFISAHTVITHRKNITSKLGIRTIAGITIYAVLNGIIDPDEVNK